jgi:hydrogenase maturation factor
MGIGVIGWPTLCRERGVGCLTVLPAVCDLAHTGAMPRLLRCSLAQRHAALP